MLASPGFPRQRTAGISPYGLNNSLAEGASSPHRLHRVQEHPVRRPD